MNNQKQTITEKRNYQVGDFPIKPEGNRIPPINRKGEKEVKYKIKLNELQLKNKNKRLYAASQTLICLLILLLLANLNPAQTLRNTEYNPDKTLKSNARVNPSTLALEFSVPLGAFPGRNGLSVPVSFSYTSKVWQSRRGAMWINPGGVKTVDIYPQYSKRMAAGWTSSLAVPRINYDYDTYYPNSSTYERYDGQLFSLAPFEEPPPGDPSISDLYYIKRLRVDMPSGGSVEFRQNDTPTLCGDSVNICNVTNFNGTYLSTDGSKMRLEVGTSQSTLYLADGGFYIFGANQGGSTGSVATSYTDKEGNTITYDNTNSEITDTLGRTFDYPLPFNLINTQDQTVGDQAVTIPDLSSGTRQVTLSWRYLKDPSSGESGLGDTGLSLGYLAPRSCSGSSSTNITGTHLFLYSSYGVRLCNVGTSTDAFNPVVLTKITLPNGKYYEFKYNLHGEIEKIIYPSGGYERFVYSPIEDIQATSPGYNQFNRGVTGRWVSAKGDGTDEVAYTYQAVRNTSPNYYKVTATNPDSTYTEQYIHDEPDANAPRPFGFDRIRTGRPYDSRAYSSTGQLLSRKLTSYIETTTMTGVNPSNHIPATRDLRPDKEVSIIFEPGAGSALATMSETTYDSNGDAQYFAHLNPTIVKRYNFIAVNLTTAQTADIATIAALFSSGDLADSSETDYLYDSNYKARNLVTLPIETRVKDAAGNVKAKSQISYDQTSTYPIISAGTDSQWTDPSTNYRGNVTTTKSWTDISGNLSVETHAQYDNFGNLRKAWDAKGNLSETEYTSTYKYAYPTKVTSAVPDSSGTNGSSTAFETTSTYDLNTGLVLTATDVNGQTTTMEYDDDLLRPTKVTPPSSAGVTEMIYTDTPGSMSVKTKSKIDSTNYAESTVYADGLGRAIKSEKKDNAGNVFVETEYDNLGRVKKVTNPYRSGDTKLWTENTYDSRFRIIKVKTPDNAEINMVFGLSTSGTIGTIKTVIDQAGKKRTGITNALGRMIRVVEDPTGQNLATDYVFDTLGNLRETVQGSQHRYFMYDALGRLLRAKQPEQDVNSSLNVTDPVTSNSSWSVGYAYDANGNITSATDANGVTVTGTYDNLNRLITRDYSDSTPDVSFYYDGKGLGSVPSYSKGKLTKVSSSVSENKYLTFDTSGRIKSSQQLTNGQTYDFSNYSYDLAGNLISQTYPSGRVVSSQIGSDGSLTSINGVMGSITKTYADNLAYTAAGAVKQMQLGNGRWQTAAFNSRLQVTQIGLGTTSTTQDLLKLEYGYGTTANNGSLQSQQITIPTVGGSSGFTASQSYNYDDLNRLSSATETISSSIVWKQTFSYDRYGNRRFDTSGSNTTTIPGGCSSAVCNPTIDTANNRFTSGQGYSYDNNGSVTQDAEGKQFVYDAENRQKTFGTGGSGTNGGEYFYDGEGKRVRKVVGAVETIFVYNAVGQLISEYELSEATPTNTTQYLTEDHLGSPRIITDQSGNVISRHDYTAFGEEVSSSQRVSGLGYTTDNIRQQYTGYERDQESGLDYAQARYYNPKHGRFTSVDPLTASASIRNPQTFNRYSYVLNSPYKFTDPLGLAAQRSSGGLFCGAEFNSCRGGEGTELTTKSIEDYQKAQQEQAQQQTNQQNNQQGNAPQQQKQKPPTEEEVEISNAPLSPDGGYFLSISGYTPFAINDGVATDSEGNVLKLGLDPQKYKYGFGILLEYVLVTNGFPAPEEGIIPTITEDISDSTLGGQPSSDTEGVGDKNKPVPGIRNERGQIVFRNADIVGIATDKVTGPTQISTSTQRITLKIPGQEGFVIRKNSLIINPKGSVKIKIIEGDRE